MQCFFERNIHYYHFDKAGVHVNILPMVTEVTHEEQWLQNVALRTAVFVVDVFLRRMDSVKSGGCAG
jgi:hypothetical protein